MVALPKPGMIASKPEPVTRHAARASVEIPDPSLAFIPFLRFEVSSQPTADAAEPAKTIGQRGAAIINTAGNARLFPAVRILGAERAARS